MPRGAPDWKPWTAIQRFSETVGAKMFEKVASVAKSITEPNATSTTFELMKGILCRVQVRFPSGPAGLLHIAIFDATTLLFPGGTATWFIGDNELIDFETEYVIPFIDTGVEKYKLTIKGWNEDDTYSHSVLVRAWVVATPA